MIVFVLHLDIVAAVSDESGNVEVTADLFYQPGDFSDVSAETETGSTLWPNHTAIPYYISSDFSTKERQVILKALRIMEKKTEGCVLFKARSDESDYIYFLGNFRGICDSKIGRIGGMQYIHLARAGLVSSSSCMETGRIQHEVMHALGFYHEQQRTDRDQYVYIRKDNIASDELYENFAFTTSAFIFGTKYDYHSVLQYDAFAFASSNKIPALVPKRGLINRMGQQMGMSPSDVARIALLYKCPLTVILDTKAAPKNADFPNFSLEPMTDDQCQLQFNDYCTSDITTQWNCTNRRDLRVLCQSDAELPILESMAAGMAQEPLRLASLDVEEQLIARYSFSPIRNQILRLQLRNCITDRVTLRLEKLNFVNLLHFELHHCHGLIIQKADFAISQRLRIITFYNTTVNVLQPGSFTDLPELRILSLEALPDSQKNHNFEPSFRDYLHRLHCSCEFAWYRSWWRSNPALRLRVQTGELYSFEGPFIGTFFNSDEFNKEDVFHPINCNADPFPLSTEWISYYWQLDYSVNDPLCNQAPTATTSAPRLSTLIVNPTTTATALTSTESTVVSTTLPWNVTIRPLALSRNKLSPGTITGTSAGVILGAAVLIAAIMAVIKDERCRSWWTSFRNDGSIWGRSRNGGPSEDYSVAFANE
ncbi:uncharacterized protein LOC129589568 [Paramacrobiotus metropolitanus]|uniref:uncharacterized protein LOC129589568 n=1 Tax=Paramacrobiotus metropolitanus TaxID=2943436 RepID=UPI0024463BEF|nr:uncharacterized protein LOC129589568 [Paramacrobiotus metropolitanus]